MNPLRIASREIPNHPCAVSRRKPVFGTRRIARWDHDHPHNSFSPAPMLKKNTETKRDPVFSQRPTGQKKWSPAKMIRPWFDTAKRRIFGADRSDTTNPSYSQEITFDSGGATISTQRSQPPILLTVGSDLQGPAETVTGALLHDSFIPSHHHCGESTKLDHQLGGQLHSTMSQALGPLGPAALVA